MLLLPLLERLVDDGAADGRSHIVGHLGGVQIIVLLLPSVVGVPVLQDILTRLTLLARVQGTALGELDGVSLELLQDVVGEVVESVV